MEQTNKNIEALYGRVIMQSRPCDGCKHDTNCCKIEVPGIGTLCLVDDKKTNLHKKNRELVNSYKNLEECYNLLLGKYDFAVNESAKICNENAKLRGKIRTIESSNYHLETEIERVKKTRDELANKNTELMTDNKMLHNQSLWQRIFNR